MSCIIKFGKREGMTLELGFNSATAGVLYVLNLHDAACFSAMLASAFSGTASDRDTARTIGSHASQSGQKEMIRPSGEQE